MSILAPEIVNDAKVKTPNTTNPSAMEVCHLKAEKHSLAFQVWNALMSLAVAAGHSSSLHLARIMMKTSRQVSKEKATEDFHLYEAQKQNAIMVFVYF